MHVADESAESGLR